MATEGQRSFAETMYVYECPRCEARHWDSVNLEETDGALTVICSVCEEPDGTGYVMQLVDEFEYNPWRFAPPDRLPV